CTVANGAEGLFGFLHAPLTGFKFGPVDSHLLLASDLFCSCRKTPHPTSAYDVPGRSCSPTKDRSVSRRSPTILRNGAGNFLTSVGMATISSPAANWGCFT